MRTLVLGSSGQIGGEVALHFEADGRYELLSPKRSELELHNREKTNQYFKKFRPELVVNAAGINGGIVRNLNEGRLLAEHNLRICFNVMEASKSIGVNRLITFAPSCGYPSKESGLLREEMYGEGSLESSSELYARAKILEQRLVLDARLKMGVQWQVLIPSNVYGKLTNSESEAGHVVESLWYKFSRQQTDVVDVWGSGNAKRNLIHKEDVASAVGFIIQKNITDPTINIVSNDNITIRELAEEISITLASDKVINYDLSKPEGARSKTLDGSVLSNYGWSPRLSIQMGLKKMLSASNHLN
jgi:GDP-L-fucose synthase